MSDQFMIFRLPGAKKPVQCEVCEDVTAALPGGLQELPPGLQIPGGGGGPGCRDQLQHGQVRPGGGAGEHHHWPPHHGVLRDVRRPHYPAGQIVPLLLSVVNIDLVNWDIDIN